MIEHKPLRRVENVRQPKSAEHGGKQSDVANEHIRDIETTAVVFFDY